MKREPSIETADKDKKRPKAELGQAFLDATNPWLRHPDLDPELLMSEEGRQYLTDIEIAIDRVRESLVNSGGEFREELRLFGASLDEYLEMVHIHIVHEQEFQVIKYLVENMKMLIDRIEIELPYGRAAGTIELLDKLQKEIRRIHGQGKVVSPYDNLPDSTE